MARSLVIVESPAKVRTLTNFLGSEYRVEASMGHVRDLPKRSMGVDVERGFEPTYSVLPEKKETVERLKRAASGTRNVILATDPDREGEAIAWHLAQALNVADPVRIEFNEITKGAVLAALEAPRRIDTARVNAQQARRVLDRLVGYELSPLISRKLRMRGLSAGRVQSVALRLIVDRERDIQAFVPQEYWTILAAVTPKTQERPFTAVMPFTPATKMSVATEDAAQTIVAETRDAEWTVAQVKKAVQSRRPRPPFMTSSLQQAASTRFGFSAGRTMRVAQSLYEGKELGEQGQVGLITYMRTDSTRVATVAQEAAREVIRETYGDEYLPAKPPVYRTKRGQDAHEAIRPTYASRTPQSLAGQLTADELRLYTLIWERFMASQMREAEVEVTTIDVQSAGHMFRAKGERVLFDGWMAVTAELLADRSEAKRKDGGNGDEEEEEPEEGAKDQQLPELSPGQPLSLRRISSRQHFTQPPPRFTEAMLIAELEKRGIGRPSTYAPTVDVIKERGYAELVERRFVPTPVGVTVNDLLVAHFPDIVDCDFTARMEDRLDSVEEGALDWHSLLAEFYGGFHEMVDRARHELQVSPVEVGENCPDCGRPLVLKRSRYGTFVGCSGYPECGYIKREADEAANSRSDAEPGGPAEDCPECGRPLVQRRGRYGPFMGCSGYPECKYIKKEPSAAPVEIGVACPREGCGGTIQRRLSRRGKPFYGCSRYPACEYVSWNRPVGRACPKDGSPLVYQPPRKGQQGSGRIVCPNKECDHSEQPDGTFLAGLSEERA